MLDSIDGPEVRNGEARSVRRTGWQIVMAGELNTHLRELGIRDECDAGSVFAVAETQFSPKMRAEVGGVLYR